MASHPRGTAPVDKERSTALAQMNLKKILRAYVQQMVDEVPGYKALLLDKDTMRICSTQYGRTELGEHNVVHVERIDSNEAKEHMELKVCAGCAWAMTHLCQLLSSRSSTRTSGRS